MQTDPLNDALVKIHNAEQAGKFSVNVTPASKLLGNVLEIMQKAINFMEKHEIIFFPSFAFYKSKII